MPYKLEWLMEHCRTGPKVKPHGRTQWFPARPLRMQGFIYDLREAWEVFRGRADAFIWPEDYEPPERGAGE